MAQIRQERSLSELYGNDRERADALVFRRRSHAPSGCGFVNEAGLATMSEAVGGGIPFAARMPAGLVPAAFSRAPDRPCRETLDRFGKSGTLVVRGDHPIVAETPEHALNDACTPTASFFVRNNGTLPDLPACPDSWSLKVDGEVVQGLDLTLGELKRRFTRKTFRMVLECGGNGRSGFRPKTQGIPSGHGAVGCAEWTGIPLAEVLRAAGVKDSARYTAHRGADPHLSGDLTLDALSRGIPLAKAMDAHGLLVFAMNGAPLGALHGGPLRLVIPGWPGSLSHKWLTRITLRDREHDGQGMTGLSYRVPSRPMVPGGKADETDFRILESMPVRSIVTFPANGAKLPGGIREVAVRGAAWAGDGTVSRVDVSIDFGATWTAAGLASLTNRYDWNRWTARVWLPSDGYYEIWARATDGDGRAQPHVAGNWNPQGYGGNAMHRVAILVG